MSLAEVLYGLHWEDTGTQTTTTGMGPAWVIGNTEWPKWAVLYLIDTGEDNTELGMWEIGQAQDFTPGTNALQRVPILSSSGIGVLANFAVGMKRVRFADGVPEALKRYIKRLEREAEARTGETAANRAAAWERITEAGRTRTEA